MMSSARDAGQTTQPIDEENVWRQLVARDRQATFLYGVMTTGVFCRPGCTSRLPRRENVRFFATLDAAQRAGFRACKRCKPDTPATGKPLDMVRAHIEAHLDRKGTR